MGTPFIGGIYRPRQDPPDPKEPIPEAEWTEMSPGRPQSLQEAGAALQALMDQTAP